MHDNEDANLNALVRIYSTRICLDVCITLWLPRQVELVLF